MSALLFGLIPAAGRGARFASEASLDAAPPKQYVSVAGKTLLEHAVSALAAEARIDTVFVVLAPDDVRFGAIDWRKARARIAPLYCGGATRRESVRNALIALGTVMEIDDWVLVHDAARPCLQARDLRRLIDTVLREAASGRADAAGGLLAIPLADTLKRADLDARIARTEPRDHLWQAQTPQMFRHGTLMRALDAVRHLPDHEARLITDESAAVERLGLKPRLVLGSTANVKVTYAADLALAAKLLENP